MGATDMNEAVKPGDNGAAAPARPRAEARSLLSQSVQAELLPEERFQGKAEGEVVEIKKIGETVAVLRKLTDHYEIAINSGDGKLTRFGLDPTSHDVARTLPQYGRLKMGDPDGYHQGQDPRVSFNELGYGLQSRKDLENRWYQIWRKGGDVSKESLLQGNSFYIQAGDWKMGVLSAKVGEKWEPRFYVTIGDSWFNIGADTTKPILKSVAGVPAENVAQAVTDKRINLPDDLHLLQGTTMMTIRDKEGRQVASFPGTGSVADPMDSKKVYFINTGRIYSLDTAGVVGRTTRPVLEQQIKVENPVEINFDPNGNFLIARIGNGEILIVDRQSGDEVKSFEGVKGPVLVDGQGDIIYADLSGQLREIQTNFKAIAPGGSEDAIRRREEELKATQERFATLELGQVQRRRGPEISQDDVASTLRETISRQVTEQITTAGDPQVLEDIMDRLQGLKADPANAAYGEVVDEFIDQARGKLSTVMLGQFDSQLGSFEQVLGEVKSVGDTIGVDEQFARLLELRQRIDITDPVRRREVERRLADLQTKKDGIVLQYQGELVEAANKVLPEIEQLVGETGSLQELTYLSGSSQVQQFEIMLANIKYPAVRRELRERFTQLRIQQREKLETVGRESVEQDRLRYAQIMEEAREDLASLREQLESTSDSREVDRFGRNPLVTAWRAKLLALPPELRQIEEQRLEIILGSRKKDLEHRRDLGAVSEGDELKFGEVTFPVYREPLRLWQPKLTPRGGEFSPWADLTFEDQQGRIFTPKDEQGGKVVVSADLADEKTKAQVERYQRQADEYFRGIKRKVPDFDEHWRITPYHMEKLEEIAETLNLQLVNYRGILLLQGEAGTGKNVVVDMLANLSNREVVSILCNENSVKEDLTYDWKYNPQKGTYEVPSRLIEGIQKPGTIILFDEINALKPGIAKMLNSLFDYRRKLSFSGGDQEREIITDPSVLFIGSMNPQNYGGVNRLSPEVKSRARVIDLDYPPFEERRDGRIYYRSDEAEMLAGYMDDLSELKQAEFRQVWDYVVNHDQTNGADVILEGNPGLESDVRRVYDVVRVANTLRGMYEAYQVGDSNEPMDFPTSLREVTDIVMEMNHRQGVKQIIKRVIIPKIDDRRQKKIVEDTIDGVMPEET